MLTIKRLFRLIELKACTLVSLNITPVGMDISQVSLINALFSPFMVSTQ